MRKSYAFLCGLILNPLQLHQYEALVDDTTCHSGHYTVHVHVTVQNQMEYQEETRFYSIQYKLNYSSKPKAIIFKNEIEKKNKFY